MTNAFSTVRNTLLTVTLFSILLPLTACEELAAPELSPSAAATAPGAHDVSADETRVEDPRAGSWEGGGLAFTLAHDTTFLIDGSPVRFYSGEGVYDGGGVVVSAFDVAGGLALYVDRFTEPDVLESLLYGQAERDGNELLFEVTYPLSARYALKRKGGRAVSPSSLRSSSFAGPETVLLKLGATTTLRGGRSIGFDAMGSDGRCPLGVECLVPGEVEADFTIDMGHGPVRASLTLPGGDPSLLPLHEAPSASVDGSIIYLVQLTPYPVADGVDDVGDGGVDGTPAPLDMGPPAATLIVRPCLGTRRRCAGGTSSELSPPVLTTIRSGNGGLANLTFRTAEGVSLDNAPLFVSIQGETHEMPLEAGPARFADPDGTIVDQATYTMSHATLSALDNAVHAEVVVFVSVGGEYVSFPYVSGDLIELANRPGTHTMNNIGA